jgi:hypothetical protein
MHFNCLIFFLSLSVDEYIQVAKEKYGYNAEQALGMLFWHKHDLDRAMQVNNVAWPPCQNARVNSPPS